MGNDLQGWTKAIQTSTDKAREHEQHWREMIGPPQRTLVVDENTRLGFWNIPDGSPEPIVFTAVIGRSGPILSSVVPYSYQMINFLVLTMNNGK